MKMFISISWLLIWIILSENIKRFCENLKTDVVVSHNNMICSLLVGDLIAYLTQFY